MSEKAYNPRIFAFDVGGRKIDAMQAYLPLTLCGQCHQPMMHPSVYVPDVLPYALEFLKQCTIAGVQPAGKAFGGSHFCQSCWDTNSITFTCHACKTIQGVTAIKESFGDPAEYLCLTCYETLTAAAWDKLTDKLEDSHRYDFE